MTVVIAEESCKKTAIGNLQAKRREEVLMNKLTQVADRQTTAERNIRG